jgi:hypothetical protein
MTRFVDAIIAYRILKKLATPFEETDAFRLGIIDKKGKLLRKYNDLNTNEERDAYTLLDRLVWRMKRIIERNPFEKNKLASFAIALSLIKEHCNANSEPLPTNFELRFNTLNEGIEYSTEMAEVEAFFSGRLKSFRMHVEDMGMPAPVNSVGAGFSGQATENPNPHLAGKDIGLGKKKIMRRKPVNVQATTK